jgi:RHS repeat-associated protein
MRGVAHCAGSIVGSNKNSGQSVFSYVYDRFGNRWQQNGSNSFLATFTGNNPGNPQNNNRMDGYSYDAAGNLMNDGAHSYTNDAENRLTKVDSGNTATYIYDADGRRVQETTTVGPGFDPAGTNIFAYDQSGRLIQKLDSSGGLFFIGNIYAGGRHLATVGGQTASGGTTFSHPDWLGTERLRTNWAAAVSESCSSLPFGDALTCSGGDISPLHFTGKERDPESGLDYFGARYNSSSTGRFMSPDPANAGASNEDPQSWNGYAYAGNNPSFYTDPDGMNYLVCDKERKNCADLSQEQYDKFRKDNPNIYSYGGNLYTVNENGTERKTGTVTSYDETIADAAAHIAGGQLLINEFVKQVGINVAIGAIGRGIGLGIEAIQAARAAEDAAQAAVDPNNLSNKIVRQMGTRGWAKQGIVDTI